jgi:hypothetical protein
MKLPGNLLAPLTRFAAKASGEIGLDLSNERANLVQFDNSAGGPLIRAAASLPYPCPRDQLLADPRQFKALIRQARSEHAFTGRSCRYSRSLTPSSKVATMEPPSSANCASG